MELVIQVDEPLDHLHPFITKSGEETQVLTVGSDTSGDQGREDRGFLQLLKASDGGKRLSLGEMEFRTICQGLVWIHVLSRSQDSSYKLLFSRLGGSTKSKFKSSSIT